MSLMSAFTHGSRTCRAAHFDPYSTGLRVNQRGKGFISDKRTKRIYHLGSLTVRVKTCQGGDPAAPSTAAPFEGSQGADFFDCITKRVPLRPLVLFVIELHADAPADLQRRLIWIELDDDLQRAHVQQGRR